MTIINQLQSAKNASHDLALFTSTKKNTILLAVAKALRHNVSAILRANKKDLVAVPVDYLLTDRLTLTAERIEHIAHSIEAVVRLPDPVGEVLGKTQRLSGLHIERRRVPLGVLGVIYEARPNVTTEIFSLAFKAGNAVVMRGGHDAYHTSAALVKVIHQVLRRYHVPIASCTLLDARNRSSLQKLVTAHGLVDVIIPRGGKGLIQFVRENATVPVIETGVGVCHTLVEQTASVQTAAAIVHNAKTRRCTVCNALDTLVIERSAVRSHLPAIAKRLMADNVVIHADASAYACLRPLYPAKLLKKSKPADYSHEWLSLQLSIKTVSSYSAGVEFIQAHTSGHSEAIITRNKRLADDFVMRIDAADVYVNTPTSFTDGFEFGLGAEVGISTQKLHARGPMGLVELTTYKWIITSSGAIRQN